MKISERDSRLLGWIGEQLLVNKQELDELLKLDCQKHGGRAGKYAVRDLIQKWRNHELVRCLYPSARGVHCYLTPKGLQVCGLPFSGRRLHSANLSSLDHHDAVNRLRLHLEREYPENSYWIAERRLMQEQPLSRAARDFRQIHRPDGVWVTLDGEQRIESAIEVERTLKSPRRLTAIVRQYVLSPTYAHTYFFYRTDSIKRALERVLVQLPQQLPGMATPAERIHLQPLPFADV
jgi:hypothetical protein